VATLVWAGFLVIGLPSYFQQYSTVAMVWFDGLLLIPLGVIVYRFLKALKPERRLRISLWTAFYFTVPLAVYDGLYCGLYLGHGWRFIDRFWYLTIYYFIPWIMLPGIAVALNRVGAEPRSRPGEDRGEDRHRTRDCSGDRD
jgi:hypothetical protein